MRELEAAALELGMYVLVEVPNPAEMEEALQLKSSLLGINNRNLKTLEVDLSVARDYAAMVPDTHRLVGESGLRTKADLDALDEVGVTSFLAGESWMREADVEAATRRPLTGQWAGPPIWMTRGQCSGSLVGAKGVGDMDKRGVG